MEINYKERIQFLQERIDEINKIIEVKETILKKQAGHRCKDLAVKTHKDIAEYRQEIIEINREILTLKNN